MRNNGFQSLHRNQGIEPFDLKGTCPQRQIPLQKVWGSQAQLRFVGTRAANLTLSSFALQSERLEKAPLQAESRSRPSPLDYLKPQTLNPKS